MDGVIYEEIAMSKPKYKWYGVIKKLILTEYYNTDTPQGRKLKEAMEATDEETAGLPNGDLRLKAISLILKEKTMTYEGAGKVVGYEGRNIQRWINTYINSVGKKAGF